MKGLYGSMLNIVHLMLNRTMLVVIAVAGVAVATYLVGEIEQARNVSQLTVLVIFPLLTVWTARSSYASKWNVFEQSWNISSFVMVVSRYILFAIINLLMSMLWAVSPMFDGSYTNLVHTVGSAYLTLAIYYPIMYMLRGEKGDLDQIIFIVSMFGSVFGAAWFGIRFGMLPMTLLIALVYVVSLILSVGFCNFHKGRAA